MPSPTPYPTVITELSRPEPHDDDAMGSLFHWQHALRNRLLQFSEKHPPKEVLQLLVNEVGQSLKADRCFVLLLKDNQPQAIEIEYRQSADVISFIGSVPPWDTCPFLQKSARQQFTYSRDVLYENEVRQDPFLQEFFKLQQVRASIACPIVYEEELFAVLAVQQGGPRTWQPHELSLSMFAADQAAISLYVARLKEANSALETYAHKLEQSNKELEQFVSVAAHDLQAPLRKVLMFSTCLSNSLSDQLPANAQNYLERMQRATRKMQNLIQDLLDLSRIGRMEADFKPINLNDLLQNEVLPDLSKSLKESGGEVRIDELPQVEGDPSQLAQLFLNLLDNALKFRQSDIPPAVRVYLETDENDPNHCIVVEDNGIGFEPHYRERVFKVFERLHGENAYTGNGIGLSICKKIAEKHNGTIQADSEPGNGSRFKLFLPTNN